MGGNHPKEGASLQSDEPKAQGQKDKGRRKHAPLEEGAGRQKKYISRWHQQLFAASVDGSGPYLMRVSMASHLTADGVTHTSRPKN